MRFVLSALPLFLLSRLTAAEIFVSPVGNDANPGTIAQPLASFTEAQTRARTLAGTQPVTVTFRAGTYYLADTARFSGEDSGTAANPVVYRSAVGETAILSGGTDLTGLSWSVHSGSILKATVPAGLVMDQLFVDNAKQVLARYPNFDANTAIFDGYAADCISTTRAAGWANPTGGFFHAMHAGRWGDMSFRITGKNASNVVSYVGGWQNNRPNEGIHATYRYVENIFEELDAEKEFFHDTAAHILYFRPPAGFMPSTTRLEAAGRLKHLVEFNGTQTAPVHHVTLRGFEFRHAARTFMEPYEPLLRSDWCIYRGGAVRLTGTEDCTVENCAFDQLGGNAVFFSNYNRRTAIRGCDFRETGASGVCFVGDPSAVRNPLFNYDNRLAYSAIDQTNSGPLNSNYPADCLVEDCLIRGIGTVEKQPAGVEISMSSRITVRHCSIYDCARSGINIGDGCWGGHIIEYCDVFDTVRETNDHGSFNSWGRDRYWGLTGSPSNSELKRISLLDAVETTTLRYSRWKCEIGYGWDIDLDDGSSNYDIHHNLMLSGGLKWREGFYRTGRKNIIPNSSLHPHVWYPESGDIFEFNIVGTAYQPASMSSSLTKWGERLDYNLFPTESARTAYSSKGADAHSLSGSPQFVDAANGNYQVQSGSPAFSVGFENFPMDQFGVTSARLKAVARTPYNTPTGGGVTTLDDARYSWLGCRIKMVETTAEASAFGTDPENGGVFFVSGQPGSAAEAAGFLENDLIVAVNGSTVKTVPEMVAALTTATAPVTFGVVRGQGPVTVTPTSLPVGTGILHLLSGTMPVAAPGHAVAAFTLEGGTVSGAGTLTAPAVNLMSGSISAGISTTGTLVKSSAATTVLGGSLTAPGLRVEGGMLRLQTTGGISPALGGPVEIAASATFDLGGISQTIASLTGAGTLANSSTGALTLTLNGASTTTFSGTVDNLAGGAISLVKTGAGTQNFTSSSGYRGDTTVSAGLLNLGQPALAAASTVRVSSPGVLGLGNFTALPVAAIWLDSTRQYGRWGATENPLAEFGTPRITGTSALSTSTLRIVTASSDTMPAVSNNDLGQTARASVSATGSGEVLSEAATLFDGQIGNTDTDSADASEVTIGPGSTVTLQLDIAAHPAGYDITGITTLMAWLTEANGRSNQGYGLTFGFVDGTSSQFLAPQVLAANSPALYATTVSFQNAAGSGPLTNGTTIARHVKSVTFHSFYAANAGSVVVAREFDVFGAPTPSGDYNAWIAAYPGLSGSGSLSASDPDSDGLANLLEFAMGSKPDVCGTGPPARLEGSDFAIYFNRAEGTTGVSLAPQWSTDLNQWHEDGFATETWNNSDGTTLRRARVDTSGQSRIFLRLRAQ